MANELKNNGTVLVYIAIAARLLTYGLHRCRGSKLNNCGHFRVFPSRIREHDCRGRLADCLRILYRTRSLFIKRPRPSVIAPSRDTLR